MAKDSNPWKSKEYYELMPDEREVVDVENFRLFFKTMKERQLIWKRRMVDKEEQPWTTDLILRDNKFTNVYRELDRSSQWEIRNIILDTSLAPEDLIWKILVYRTFNNPDTFEGGKDRWRNGVPGFREWDEDEFAGFIHDVRASGHNPFTNAYYMNSTIKGSKSRDNCYCYKVLPALHRIVLRVLELCNTAKKPKEFIDLFKTVPTVADFIAHEYYQDLTYIERYTGRKIFPFTQNDYTNVGPGASQGIRLIFPNTPTSEQVNRIYDLRFMAEVELGTDMPYLYWDVDKKRYLTGGKCNITLHQIEMWLCEFSKYWKMLHQVGKQRSRFTPHTNTELL